MASFQMSNDRRYNNLTSNVVNTKTVAPININLGNQSLASSLGEIFTTDRNISTVYTDEFITGTQFNTLQLNYTSGTLNPGASTLFTWNPGAGPLSKSGKHVYVTVFSTVAGASYTWSYVAAGHNIITTFTNTGLTPISPSVLQIVEFLVSVM